MNETIQKYLYQKKIYKILKHLQKIQNLDGSFPSYIDTKKETSKEVFFTNALTSKILQEFIQSQGQLNSNHIFYFPNMSAAKDIVHKLNSFIHKQKNTATNTWNYHNKIEDVASYPDDLDDTFVALHALSLENEEYIDSKNLVSIINMLDLCRVDQDEEFRGYNTWIVDLSLVNNHWRDVDIAIQIHIYLFLQSIDSAPELLLLYIESRLKENNLESKYYSRLYIFYLLSRLSRPCSKKLILEKVLEYLRKNTEQRLNYLEKSLLLLTLLNLDENPCLQDKLAKYIRRFCYKGDEVLYIEYIRKEETIHRGSIGITSALSILSMSKCLENYEKIGVKKESLYLENKIFKDSLDIVSDIVSPFGNPNEIILEILKYECDLNSITNLSKAPRQLMEIILESTMWVKHIRHHSKQDIKTLTDCGAGMLLGWIAYSIYDSILDRQLSESYLPLANTCHRKSYSLFLESCPKEMRLWLNDTFKKIDYAEHKETLHQKDTNNIQNLLDEWNKCDHVSLGNRSIGHIIGPLISLSKLSINKKFWKKYSANVEKFYSIYLAMRQLSDDIKDAEEDRISNRNTWVTACIMSLGLADNRLDDIFIDKILPKAYETISLWHKEATEILTKIEHLSPYTKILQKNIDRIKKSTRKSLVEAQTMRLLRNKSF